MNGIDFVAAAVAALATLGVGAIWYAPPIFGDAWAREAGLAEKPSREKAIRTMLIGYLISLVVTCTLSWLLGPSPAFEHATWSCTLIGAVLVGGSYAINTAFGGRSWRMFLIDWGYHTLQFAAFGAILSLMG